MANYFTFELYQQETYFDRVNEYFHLPDQCIVKN